MLGVKQEEVVSYRQEDRQNYIHLNGGLAYFFHQQLLPPSQTAFRAGDLAKQQRIISSPLPVNQDEWSGRHRVSEVPQNPEMWIPFLCARKLWPIVQMWDVLWPEVSHFVCEGVSSRLRVWKWKPKRECFSQRVFPVRPPGHWSNCQKVERLIHISPPTLFLCLSVCPSFLTLFVSRHGRSHLSDRVLKDSRLCTAGCGICGGEWWWIRSQSLKERAFKE